MKWHAQVLHVARKDLRLSRWLLLAYAAAVAAVTAAAAEWGAFAEIESPVGMLAVILLGTILLAFLVQADSPARGDSLWVILPLRPSAVLGAKLLLGVIVLIGIPLIGQLVGLRAHAVAPGDLPGLLGQSALSYGGWLAVAAVFAALTSDLRSFLVALILTGLVWMIGVPLVLSGAGSSGPPRWSTLPLIAAAMLLLLAHQYLTRNVRRGALMGVGLSVAVVALLAVPARSAAPAAASAGLIPRHLRPASIEIGELSLRAGSQTGFAVHLVGASSSHHYVLVAPMVRIRMADGSSAVVPARDPLVSLNEPVPRVKGLRSVGERQRAPWFAGNVVIELSPEQRQALAAGQARLSLQGRLEVRELRARLELPLRAGATAAEGGSRVRITSVESLPEGPAVEVHTSEVGASVREGPDERMYGMPAPEHLLVSRSRREALQLRRGGVSESDFALVLPGPRARSSTTELGLEVGPPGEAPRIGPEWIGAARLLLVRWVPVGSGAIAVEDQGRGYRDRSAESNRPGRRR